MSEDRKESLTEKKISRRSVLRWVGALGASVAVGAGLEYGAAQILVTPQPVTKVATVSEAFKNRKSTNSFQPQPLSNERLLDLLWAAWGINRPDSGKRTAPSAMNSQEIDIYVLLPEGVYVYDAKGNQLTPVLAQDLRTKAATQAFMREAPVHLLFVADYAKFRANTPQAQKELFSAAHTGFIGQNVYLYCASIGLGAHFHTSIDRASLKDSLKLRDDQAIVFAQAVGYPKT
ncbi:MAG: nitroreductase family protein [Candidatus Bathyarchaeia archaeon]